MSYMHFSVQLLRRPLHIVGRLISDYAALKRLTNAGSLMKSLS